MVLLTLLAVGLLSLSSVSLRASGQSKDLGIARTNARLALEMGIAQLQRQAGPDQRICAAADLLQDPAPADDRKGWVGIWQSNPRTPTDFTRGRPGSFQSWLVTNDGRSTLEDLNTNSAEMVTLESLADGSETRVPLAKAPDGRLAWWTSDESMKAPIDLPEQEPTSPGERLVRRHAPERPIPQVVPTMANLSSAREMTDRLVTPGQASLALDGAADDLERHFTVATRAVLSNVRDGGLKKDLSTLFELPENSIPREFGQWTGRDSLNNRQVYLYGNSGVALGARWNHLYAYYNLYKDVRRIDDVPYIEPGSRLIDWRLADRYQDFGDDAGGFRFPRIAKIIYVFSYTSRDVGRGRYQLELGTDIFVTLWNPFDTGILFPADAAFFTKFSKGLPFRFQWYLNGRRTGQPTTLQQIADGSPLFVSSIFRNPGKGRTFQMAPGETIVFSMNGRGGGSVFGSQPEFLPGIHYEQGITSDNILGPGGQLTGENRDRVSVTLDPVNDVQAYTIGGQPTSQYVDFWIYDTRRQWPYYEHRGELIAKNSTPFRDYMDPITEDRVRSVTLSEVAGRRQPFAAFVIETKTAGDSKFPVPAFLFTGNTRLSSRLDGDPSKLAYERLEYSLEAVSGWDSDIIQATLPGDPSGSHHGYIGSGRSPATGRTHMISHSIPEVPPVSLAAFRHASTGDGAATLRATHWGFNSTPNAPYADSAIGNSYAHPLLPNNRSTSGTDYDHCLLANEALWDGWFLSSLAPRAADRFGESQSLEETWKRFLVGEADLLNPRFLPHLGERSTEEVEGLVVARRALSPNAHRNIAAHLMLAGPFNVNSTSVDAWSSFLASTRGDEIDRLTRSGRGTTERAEGTLFSRTERVIHGAVEEGNVDAYYAGYRDLDDEKIRQLAEEIVAEVRTRGPFLNLAEFVNRRLDRDAETSLSGAIQTAIDRSGLNDEIARGVPSGSASPMGARVMNRDAATLNAAAGAPGWLMQGDLLDPLGPFITVRGDTFRIRAYGDATDSAGRPVARTWCEALVQRVPDWINPADSAELWPARQKDNQRFGRRFEVISFRWLPESTL